MSEDTILFRFEELREEGFLSAIDVEFCRFLQEMNPEANEYVLLAACHASAAYQSGNVCIVLEDTAGRKLFPEAPGSMQITAPSLRDWLSLLDKSTLVGRGMDFKPLILDDANRLYLQKQWYNEQQLVIQILKKARTPNRAVDIPVLKDGLRRLFEDSSGEINWQEVAAAAAVLNTFTVISGGPGTGKTTTVVRLLGLLIEQGRKTNDMPSIALAAPTGKAAARLESSIREGREQLPVEDEIRKVLPAECQTIHQLLGARRHTARFKYSGENPLPYDYVIIDEVSMVDQALMRALMDALRPRTQLLLLGDKDQLASVEAGSVLGDICSDLNQNQLSPGMQEKLEKLDINIPEEVIISDAPALTDNIILLQKSYRFATESGIGQLSHSINVGDADQGLAIFKDASFEDVSLIKKATFAEYIGLMIDEVATHFQSMRNAESRSALFDIYNQFQVLSPHRRGPWGADQLNTQIEKGLVRSGLISAYDDWYKGKPVIINENNYTLGLNNGDVGICMPDSEGTLKIFFQMNDTYIDVLPSRLPDFSTGFVMTVHKSQGSEFEDVWLVLPDRLSPVLSRELLYTAITRARSTITILGSTTVFRDAMAQKIARKSGLEDYLWNSPAV